MNVYWWGSADIEPCFLNHGTRWASVALCLEEELRYPLHRTWVSPTADVDALQETNIYCPARSRYPRFQSTLTDTL